MFMEDGRPDHKINSSATLVNVQLVCLLKHNNIRYLGKFKSFWFNDCKVMAHSNLRHFYGKSQP